MGVQEFTKEDRKLKLSVHASHSAHARVEDPLLPDKRMNKQLWWQRISQSINLAGTWLFLQILFVSLSTFAAS